MPHIGNMHSKEKCDPPIYECSLKCNLKCTRKVQRCAIVAYLALFADTGTEFQPGIKFQIFRILKSQQKPV